MRGVEVLVPKLNPPPGAAVGAGAGAVVVCALDDPKLNPPKESPAGAVVAGAAAGAGAIVAAGCG